MTAFALTLLVILAIMILMALLIVTGIGLLTGVWLTVRGTVLFLFAPSTIKFTIKWLVLLIIIPQYLKDHAPNFVFGVVCASIMIYVSYCVCGAIVRMYCKTRGKHEQAKRDVIEKQILAELKVNRTARKSRPIGKNVA